MVDRVVIREARREDCCHIIRLSGEIANYHKHYNSPQVDVKVLENDTFNVENPFMGFYIADIDGEVVGYAHYYYTYSIRAGKSMCLQDLYVVEKYRNLKIGDKLMNAVAKKAHKENCKKIEFIVSDWNPAVNFYMSRGAYNMTTSEGFHFFKFDKKSIDEMAEKSII